MAIEDKPLTGDDAERQPTRPDDKEPAYREGADRIAPSRAKRPG